MRFIFMLAIFVMPTIKAQVVEIPTTFKAAEPKPVLKCENGSCWVYHGTSIHVDFSRGVSSGEIYAVQEIRGEHPAYCASCQHATIEYASCSTCSHSFRSDTYCSKPCLIARDAGGSR